jgi:hypothetical protein
MFARLSLAALTAALLIAVASGPAAARNRIELRPSGRVNFSGRVTFEIEPVLLICDITLNSTMARLIQKVRNTLVGATTAGRSTNCRDTSSGTAQQIWLYPFTYAFNSITGTLPSITGLLLLVIGGFLIEDRTSIGDLLCLYGGTVGIEARENPIRRFTYQAGWRLALVRDLIGSLPCPSFAILNGLYSWTPEETVTLLER